MQFSPAILAKALVTVVLICALSAVGFAHKSAGPELTPELAEFLAAGGALSDICSKDQGRGQPNHVDCEACRISDSTVAPGSADAGIWLVLEKIRIHAFVAKRLSNSQSLDPSRLTRAPPQA